MYTGYLMLNQAKRPCTCLVKEAGLEEDRGHAWNLSYQHRQVGE